MPHTNRKKNPSTTAAGRENKSTPKLVHTKRQQISDSEGWTHIIDTPLRSQVKAKEGLGSLHAGDFERDGVAYVQRTPEEMRGDLDYYTKLWEVGEGCRVLKEKLHGLEGDEGNEAGKMMVRRRRIENVVCLGLGSLQSARRDGRRSSFTQLAALRTIIETLAGDQKLQCIFQDPQFTDLDKDFLVCLGYVVVDDPVAFGHITGKSLVYAIHCYAQVYNSVAEEPRPAVMIGTDVENFGRFNLSESAESITKNLEDMVKDCEALDFPQVRHDFSDTKIYWRRIEEPTAV